MKIFNVLLSLLAVTLAVLLFIQKQKTNRLNLENESSRSQLADRRSLIEDNTRLSNLLAHPTTSAPSASASTNDQFKELMKLRGEVSLLRQEKRKEATASNTGPSMLTGLTSTPEAVQLIRTQQKAGMGMIYKGLSKRLNLSAEQGEKLNDLLADNVMENITHITEALRDGKTAEEREQVFASQELALDQKIQDLLGPEGFAQYQDYTHNLGSYLTSEQFKGMLTGNDEAKQSQTKQLYSLMQEETKAALSNAGLSENYQVVPILNFRNIASEEDGQFSLKLLEDIYNRVGTRASSFLNPEELKKFGDFKTAAINNNRLSLMMNRKMMAPGAK
jgi:hypothetical protein